MMQTVHLSEQQIQGWRVWSSGLRVARQAVVDVAGPADTAGLCRAGATVLARHEVLRTAYAAGGIASSAGQPPPVLVCDLTTVAQHAFEAVCQRCVCDARGWLVSQALVPPALLLLIRAGDLRHRLVLTASPLAADARSFERYVAELSSVYHGEAQGEDLFYPDVCAWQEELSADDQGDIGRRYWADRRRHDADGSILQFEVDATSAEPRASRSIRLGGDAEARAVARTAADIGCSTAALWLACWQALLHRLSNGTSSVVGVTLDGRQYGELATVIGPLDRTVPVPSAGRSGQTMGETARSLDATLRDHADWLEYSLSGGDADAESPDTVFWRRGFAHVGWSGPLAEGALVFSVHDAVLETSGGALALTVHEQDERRQVRLHFDPRRFAAPDVQRFGRWLLTLAEAAAARPSARWDDLPWLTRSERMSIVTTWNETAVVWPAGVGDTIAGWIERQAAQTPAALALWSEEETWSYARLDAEANRLAQRLRQLGVGTEDRVGVWMQRSPLLAAALLGVLKAGGAYVPLDPGYPAARLETQVADARARVVLTETACAPHVPAGAYTVEVLDSPDPAWRQNPSTPPATLIAPTQLAYIIYTSGSTGTPKGVMNSHAAVLNGLRWMRRTFGLTAADRVLQRTSVNFDVSVWELFGPLGCGATVVLAKPEGQQDPSYLADLIERTGVTVAQFVPAVLDAFVTGGGLSACASLRLIANCGEALSGPLVARVRAAWPGRIENLYGPTEAAVEVTSHSCGMADEAVPIVPIGRPIDNTQTYIVDRAGQPVAAGVIGELLIGGAQVGRGYWGRPEVTADRFIPDPFGEVPGARLYRSGDLTRYRGSGVIEYVGRADHQVKIGGHRIELGEVAAVLRQQPGVRDAAVVLRQDSPGDRRLVAYVVPAPAAVTPDAGSLKQQLRAHLPEAWIPAVILDVEALPLTPNGKVDRRRLPEPSSVSQSSTAYAPPRTEVEVVLAGIWTDVLRVERVGLHDNFFALGGDSILSLQIVARAMRAGWRLAPRDVFEQPTIAQLSAAATVITTHASETAPVVGPVPLTPIQRRFFDRHETRPHHANQAVRLDLNPAVLRVIDQAWARLVDRHDALRLRYARAEGAASRASQGSPGVWTQRVVAVDVTSRVSSVDLRGVADDALPRMQARVAADAAASLNVIDGPVARAVVCLARGASPALLMVAHQLVVDAMSWRILLEDLDTVCRRLDARLPIAWPPKSTSIRRWAEALEALGVSEGLGEPMGFGAPAGERAATLAPRPLALLNTVRASRTLEQAIGCATTQALVHELPARGTGAVPEFLLAGVMQAFAEWTGETTWPIDVEAHGREPWQDLDLSRTVGWLTALHSLRLTAGVDMADTLAAVKAAMRAVPHHGFGHGVLRPLDDRPQAEILFTYLGEVDHLIPSGEWMRPSTGAVGRRRHPDDPRDYLMEIHAAVTGGDLRVRWTYAPHLHDTAGIGRLTDAFAAAIRRLVSAADALDTPADFGDVALDEDDLERISRLVEARSDS